MFLPANITLQFGDTGDFVTELQRRLSTIQLLSEMMVNGAFDGNTVNAVKSFQSMHGIRVDGVAGPETLRRLAGVLSGESSSNTSDNKQEEEKQQRRDANFYGNILLTPAPVEPSLEALIEAAAAGKGPPSVTAAAVESTPTLHATAAPRAETIPTPDLQRNAAALLSEVLAQSAPPPAPERMTEATRERAGEARQPPELKSEAAKSVGAKAEEPKREMETNAEPRRPLSAFIQKIIDYIESKLPRHITQEVKEIGHTMLKAGVREAGGIQEATARAQEIEAVRGAPAAQQQRG
ncbi:MAG: peptidoglycan-binding domain-containing protein [Alphaproteobacteria bacterium]